MCQLEGLIKRVLYRVPDVGSFSSVLNLHINRNDTLLNLFQIRNIFILIFYTNRNELFKNTIIYINIIEVKTSFGAPHTHFLVRLIRYEYILHTNTHSER